MKLGYNMNNIPITALKLIYSTHFIIFEGACLIHYITHLKNGIFLSHVFSPQMQELCSRVVFLTF